VLCAKAWLNAAAANKVDQKARLSLRIAVLQVEGIKKIIILENAKSTILARRTSTQPTA
jgi:hypothetical protein